MGMQMTLTQYTSRTLHNLVASTEVTIRALEGKATTQAKQDRLSLAKQLRYAAIKELERRW